MSYRNFIEALAGAGAVTVVIADVVQTDQNALANEYGPNLLDTYATVAAGVIARAGGVPVQVGRLSFVARCDGPEDEVRARIAAALAVPVPVTVGGKEYQATVAWRLAVGTYDGQTDAQTFVAALEDRARPVSST